MFFQAFIVSLLGIAAAAPPAGSIAPSHPGFRGSRVTKRDYNSGNWCGYVHSARSVTSVEATWVVPSIAAPPEGAGSGDYWSYQWVGIDGDKSSCNNLLQGGTGSLLQNGQVWTFAWYEFYPTGPVYPDLTINVGDTVYTKVTATSATTGTILIENLSTGESETYRVTSQNGPLCQGAAEWIQEYPTTLYPEFSNFVFSNSTAVAGGKTIDLAGSEPWYLTGGGKTLCSAKATSNTNLAVYYQG